MPTWRKSSFCNGASACVEVQTLPDGSVLMRDGKDPDGPVLTFTRAEWAAFVAGVRDGEFDLPALSESVSDGHGGGCEGPVGLAGADLLPD